jgi:hypothetical protein
MTERPVEVTPAAFRATLAAVGLDPSEAELTAALPVVQSLYEGARQVEALLALEHEPATGFAHRPPAPGGR